jgi:hypothetical protein
MDEPEIIPPSVVRAVNRAETSRFYAEVAELANMPEKDLRALLAAQLDMLSVGANHAALKLLKELSSPAAKQYPVKLREALVKELMGYGMFADSVSRQRGQLSKGVAMPLDQGGQAQTIEVPKTLDDKSWEEKYGNTFMDKVAVKTDDTKKPI